MTAADDALDRLANFLYTHEFVGDSDIDAAREALATVRDELQRLNTRLTKTNEDRHQWRERAISAEQQLALHGPSDELQRLREEREDTAGIAGLINRMKQAERRASRNMSAAETYKQRAEAAEAEVRRLTEGLREELAEAKATDPLEHAADADAAVVLGPLHEGYIDGLEFALSLLATSTPEET